MKAKILSALAALSLTGCIDDKQRNYDHAIIVELTQRLEAAESVASNKIAAANRLCDQKLASYEAELAAYRMQELRAKRNGAGKAEAATTRQPSIVYDSPTGKVEIFASQAQATAPTRAVCPSCRGYGHVVCPACRGGKFGASQKVASPCKDCGGAGSTAQFYDARIIKGGAGRQTRTEKGFYERGCAKCGGTGKVYTDARTYCPTCNGSGAVACPACSGR